MSDETAKKIGTLLKEQIELQKQVNLALINLHAAIIKHDLELVKSCTYQQDQLTEKMAVLEKQRIQAIASLDGVKNPTLPLLSILPLLPEKFHARLRELRLELKKLLAENAQLTTKSEILLEDAIINSKKGIEIIANAGNSPTGYNTRGKSESYKRNIINRKG